MLCMAGLAGLEIYLAMLTIASAPISSEEETADYSHTYRNRFDLRDSRVSATFFTVTSQGHTNKEAAGYKFQSTRRHRDE